MHALRCVLVTLAFAGALLFTASPVFAAEGDYTALTPIAVPGMQDADKFTGCTTEEIRGTGQWVKNADGKTETWIWDKKPSCLPKYLRTLYNTGIALAGLFLVFSIVRGGFTLMFTDSVLGKLEGKKIILQALGGAVIVYSSYLFVNLINPQLGDDLNLSLKFPRVVIQKFESLLVPVPSQEEMERRLLSALGKQESKAVADAQKWTVEAADWRKKADELPAGDPQRAVYLENARLLELDARTVLVAKKGDGFGEIAKTAAQNANPGAGGAEDQNIRYAREQLGKMDLEYRGDSTRPGVTGIIEKGGIDRVSTLYERWNSDYNATERAIAESYIKKNLVGGTETAWNNIVAHSEQLIENLGQYKSDNPDAAQEMQRTIDTVKQRACSTLQYIRDSCKAQSLSCRSYPNNLSRSLLCEFRE